jgi:anti-anti-sigma factor
MAFRVEHRTLAFEDVSVELVDVIGEIDATAADDFRRALRRAIAAGPGDVVLSFERCRFGDTTIVRPIAGAMRELRRRDRRLAAVVCDDDAVRTVLDFSGLRPQIALFATQGDAIASLREAAHAAD